MFRFRINHLFLSFGLIFILSLNLLAQGRTWTTFDSPIGEWSILAPGTLRPDAEAQNPKSKVGSYSYVDFNSFFVVIYRTYSAWDWFSQKDRFNKQRDLVLKQSKGKLMRDLEFAEGDIKGREIYIRMPDNRVISRESNIKPKHRVQRFRMFFQGKRMYVILAVLPEEEIDTPQIDNFFKSFAFKTK